VAGPNWTALQATVSARYAGGEADTLTPQARVFANPPGTRTESALKTRWNGQLYVVLGKRRRTAAGRCASGGSRSCR
jgi:cytochrome c-type biogenesis protein CcmF